MRLPVYWASIAEAVDYGEVKTGTRVSGLAFGGILFFQKLGMGLAGGFMGFSATSSATRRTSSSRRHRCWALR
jgi:Na+/melibiose symporter-like transporter